MLGQSMHYTLISCKFERWGVRLGLPCSGKSFYSCRWTAVNEDLEAFLNQLSSIGAEDSWSQGSRGGARAWEVESGLERSCR